MSTIRKEDEINSLTVIIILVILLHKKRQTQIAQPLSLPLIT